MSRVLLSAAVGLTAAGVVWCVGVRKNRKPERDLREYENPLMLVYRDPSIRWSM